MVLIGIFSTHLMYMLLAAVYVFGFGAYALNVKKNSDELSQLPLKIINCHESGFESAQIQADDCYEWDQYQADKLCESAFVVKITYDFHLVKKLKYYGEFYAFNYDFKLPLQIASRPPPFVV